MVVFAVAFLMSGCFGVIAQALPAALMRSGSSANAATTLGTLGSVSALVEVMLSNSFGKITDAIGRKPVLILAPALAVAARATVVLSEVLDDGLLGEGVIPTVAHARRHLATRRTSRRAPPETKKRGGRPFPSRDRGKETGTRPTRTFEKDAGERASWSTTTRPWGSSGGRAAPT